MRPREETSAEPIVCADVNEGLIEVSPSLVKPVAAVKPPSGISGRFLSGISFERLLDHPRRRVDWRAETKLRNGGAEKLAGVSLLRFDPTGLVVEQRDFWGLR